MENGDNALSVAEVSASVPDGDGSSKHENEDEDDFRSTVSEIKDDEQKNNGDCDVAFEDQHEELLTQPLEAVPAIENDTNSNGGKINADKEDPHQDVISPSERSGLEDTDTDNVNESLKEKPVDDENGAEIVEPLEDLKVEAMDQASDVDEETVSSDIKIEITTEGAHEKNEIEMNKEDKEMITNLFQYFDADDSGSMSTAELGNFMRAMGRKGNNLDR